MAATVQTNGVREPRPISRADLQAEIARLEEEYVKGRRLLIDTQADLLRIQGGIQTLKAVLEENGKWGQATF